MTISSTTIQVSYTGDDATTAFPVTYPFFGTATDAELIVLERIIATGAESTKVNGTDYNVSGGSGSTGTVTAVVAPASTVQWIIRRQTIKTQEVDYVENDPFPAESHEGALDRLTAIVQEVGGDSDDAFKYPATYTGGGSTVMPEPASENYLRWNTAADALENNVRPSAVLSGSGVPSSALGFDGDFYIDTGSDDIYGPKASGAWGAATSLVGPTGATGSTGATGPAGADGTDGADGIFTGAEATVPPTVTDNLPLYDTSDSGNPRQATVQSIVDLASGGTFDFTNATVTPTTSDNIPLYDNSDSDNPKKATVQSIVDLAAGGTAKAFWRGQVSGGTPSLSESFNLSSITDLGSGQYYMDFTSAMNTATYSSVASSRGVAAGRYANYWEASTTARVYTLHLNLSAVTSDPDFFTGAVYGDLA